jgi:hypothetical protein
MAAGLAQILGQAMTAWAGVFGFFTIESMSIWLIAPLFAAFVVPFRHDGSARDRAMSNFGAAIAVAGVFWWELLFGVMDGLLGTGGGLDAPFVLMMLTAAVLYSLAGGIFWINRELSP